MHLKNLRMNNKAVTHFLLPELRAEQEMEISTKRIIRK